ncbi:MAG: hypothetical protein KKD18_02480 [Nanoarchaeota archaeon]|nr:hypothetical protein [Nanoarchaeota archaeon]MBU0977257.1 hypothetical protein [Nanoarchaeota archaeon]
MIQQSKNKKAQEEMVGFVLIMLVVAIIFLIFLGLYLRGASSADPKENKDVAAFLEAVSKVTTPCGTVPQMPFDVTELIPQCLTNPSLCSNGRSRCEVLKETLKESIESSWNFNRDSPTKGYIMQILQETSSGEADAIPPISGGLITSDKIYASQEKPLPGGIILRLIIYR